MSIVGPAPGAGSPGLTTGDHYVAWNNLLSQADELTGGGSPSAEFPLTNAATWAPYELWKSTNSASSHAITIELAVPTAVNCFGFYAHNLNSGNCEVRLQHSDDDATYSDATGFGGLQVPTNDGPWIRIGDEETHKWWRINFQPNGTAPQAGIVFIGLATKLYRAPGVGFVPPLFSKKPRVLNNRAPAGGFLGRSVQRNWGETGFEISHVPIAWARTTFSPFLEHARTLPFLYGWDTDDYEDDVAFCFTDGELETPNYSAVEYMRCGLRFTALTE